MLEDVWYIIPAKEIRGLKSISLCTTGSEAKYEGYREAWQLLREASGGEEAAAETPLGPGLARMQAAMNYFKYYLERGEVHTRKPVDEG